MQRRSVVGGNQRGLSSSSASPNFAGIMASKNTTEKRMYEGGAEPCGWLSRVNKPPETHLPTTQLSQRTIAYCAEQIVKD